MKTITKKYHLLEQKELERALSEHFNRKITLGEVKCTLQHCMPPDEVEPYGAYLEFTAGDDKCDSFDLFWNNEKHGHYLGKVHLSLENEWPTPEEVFAFSVVTFASFSNEIDTSD